MKWRKVCETVIESVDHGFRVVSDPYPDRTPDFQAWQLVDAKANRWRMIGWGQDSATVKALCR